MSHYLLRLCLPSAEWGKQATELAQAHKDLPRAEYGWSRQLHGNKAMYVILRVCLFEDEECLHYQAWLEHREAHEDDKEAEALTEGTA
jgi:hypothetical protein